ncbi:MAG: enoyl-CoA hydratase-related protein [Desulfobacterales bacterium]|nr:enoyl-CoA hydratase-related protein [Desulfobacterales bacterium]
MEFTSIIYEKKDHIATITLNRPKFFNAINDDILTEMGLALDDITADDDIRAVIVTGNEKAFGAGADIKEISTFSSPSIIRKFVGHFQEIFNKLENLPKPTVAAVSGLCFGGGCEITLSCDIRIAADNAQFGLPEIKLAILPGAGGTQRLQRLVGSGYAKQMIFTGDPIDAAEAYRIGLVNKLVPLASLMDEAKKLAKTLAERPGFTLRTIKGLMDAGRNMPLSEALKHEMMCFESLFATYDQKEGVTAFIEKRKPEFKHQ